jgi:carboxymethylenebutenolidase
MTENNKYLAVPMSGKGAGVLVLHAWWGLNDFFKDFCERLSREGFVALAPDLYHGEVATTIEQAEQLRDNMNEKQVRADILSAAEQLLKLPAVKSNSLGAIGFSLGAYWALWLSRVRPEYVKAVTIFYGDGDADYSHAESSYLGHFAETDDWVSAGEVKQLEQSLRTANRPATFYTYEDTAHWFFEEDRLDAYSPRAAELAWRRTLGFLHATLDE